MTWLWWFLAGVGATVAAVALLWLWLISDEVEEIARRFGRGDRPRGKPSHPHDQSWGW